jgi:hypothetical protein
MSRITDTSHLVIRSGCWGNTNPAAVCAAYRDDNVGFRCALRVREPVVKP